MSKGREIGSRLPSSFLNHTQWVESLRLNATGFAHSLCSVRLSHEHSTISAASIESGNRVADETSAAPRYLS